MGNLINSTILVPLIPLDTSLFIFILLLSFNRTLNRLTKPVTALVALSLLNSAFISSFDYFKKIEEHAFETYTKYLKDHPNDQKIKEIAQDELNHVKELNEALLMLTKV